MFSVIPLTKCNENGKIPLFYTLDEESEKDKKRIEKASPFLLIPLLLFNLFHCFEKYKK